ncbi:hypothetical protein GEMRC1_009196 [Eukaryota sp. GEM-RC1]
MPITSTVLLVIIAALCVTVVHLLLLLFLSKVILPPVFPLSTRSHHPKDLIPIITLGLATSLGSESSSNSDDLNFFHNDTHIFSSSPTPFSFRTYTPAVYENIRNRFSVSNNQLIESLCSSCLRVKPTTGKSSALFYWSKDDLFIVKTLSKNESKYLRSILFRYYQYILAHPHTLLPWFLGHYRLTLPGPFRKSQYYFIVLKNLFATNLSIRNVFDLKGSSAGRTSLNKTSGDFSKTLKDNDFINIKGKHSLPLGSLKKSTLMTQLCLDCNFLLSVNSMDYSFLIGLAPSKTSKYLYSKRKISLLSQGPKAPAYIGDKNILQTMFTIDNGGFSSMSRLKSIETPRRKLSVINSRDLIESELVSPRLGSPRPSRSLSCLVDQLSLSDSDDDQNEFNFLNPLLELWRRNVEVQLLLLLKLMGKLTLFRVTKFTFWTY